MNTGEGGGVVDNITIDPRAFLSSSTSVVTLCN